MQAPARAAGPVTLLAVAGALAAVLGLALVLGVMFVEAADGMDYATWSWVATALVWPLGVAASLAALRSRLWAPVLMLLVGLGASFLFVWEYGQVGGVPLAMAGAALLVLDRAPRPMSQTPERPTG